MLRSPANACDELRRLVSRINLGAEKCVNRVTWAHLPAGTLPAIAAIAAIVVAKLGDHATDNPGCFGDYVSGSALVSKFS